MSGAESLGDDRGRTVAAGEMTAAHQKDAMRVQSVGFLGDDVGGGPAVDDALLLKMQLGAGNHKTLQLPRSSSTFDPVTLAAP